MTRLTLLFSLAITSTALLRAQEVPPFQSDFPVEEFVQRRGRTRRTTLYLSHRNDALERATGKMWSAEDAAEVTRLTGGSGCSKP